MSKRRWTIVIVPQGSSASKILELSTTALKLAGSVGIAVTLLATLLGYATVRRSIDLARSDRLERENTRLARDLDLLHERLSPLSDTVATLAVRDGQVRLLANLDPIDSEVHAAGIGGPRLTPPKALASPLPRPPGHVRAGVGATVRT